MTATTGTQQRSAILDRMLFAVPSQLGYAALGGLVLGESAGVPLPGETALITAGGLVAAGHLSLPLVILIAAGAAIVGTRWATGRVAAVAGGSCCFGMAAVFLGRWVPGVRIVAGVTAGAASMPWRHFAPANAAGALAWAASIATLAVLAGPAGSLALAAAGLAVGGVTLALAWRARRRHRLLQPALGALPRQPAPRLPAHEPE